MSKWMLLSAAILAEVFGTSVLKAADGFTHFWASVPMRDLSLIIADEG